MVRRRIVNVKNMGALTSNGNFQPNKNKTGESPGTWLPGEWLCWEIIFTFLEVACSNETGVECSTIMEKQSFFHKDQRW